MTKSNCIHDNATLSYSIVIPALNGLESLRTTIPYMLKSDRYDFEIIVSDNCSSDGTIEYLRSINDERLVVVSPLKRLPHSSHLNFAYQYARGEWISHIGDDDIIMPYRFQLCDDIIAKYFVRGIDVIIGKSIRYVWPMNYFEPPNSISSQDLFDNDDSSVFINSSDIYQEYINKVSIPGGGEFLIRREIIQKLFQVFGFFCPDSPYVEFFGLRAALFYSRNVVKLNQAIYVNGRMAKSIGNALLAHESKFDWSFENPLQRWRHIPIEVYSYPAISLDAALEVEQRLSTRYYSSTYWGSVFISYAVGSARGTHINNIRFNRIDLILKCFRFFPFGSMIGILRIILIKVKSFILSKIQIKFFSNSNFDKLINNRYISGDVLGIKSIEDTAKWYSDFRLHKNIK